MSLKLGGTMLTPGVSANRRLYTPELIQKAYERLDARIKDGTRPATMLTYHEAGDDSTKIVGRLTGVEMNDGNLDYTAELADTHEASTIGGLVAPKDGSEPFLSGVSIRGWWVGEPKATMVAGEAVTTADDMEIDGLDFTKNPGVTGAYVAALASEPTESGSPRIMIYESVEAVVDDNNLEAKNTKPYGSVRYADPGYQSDKVKRYPIDTKKHALAAWSYINQDDNAKLYTAAQLKRVKARIKSALKGFGVDTTKESLEMPKLLTEAATTLSECYACSSPTGTAGFSISAYNGPLTVQVSAYNGIEPEDLADVAAAAMSAACDAIHAMDPDDDGDIDTGTSETAPVSPTLEETTPVDETQNSTNTEETAPATEQAPVTENEASAPAEEQPVEETAPAALTRADLEEAVAKAVSAALNPPAESAETSEAAPTPEELRESIRAEIIAEAVKNGLITRKGIVENTADPEPEKPLHEMSEEEFRAYQQKMSSVFFAHNQ